MESRFSMLLLAMAVASQTFSLSLRAELLTATMQTPPPAGIGYFKLGTTRNPAGHEIGVNSRSLLFDGQPVFPVMGEFHYSRTPAGEWREELLKLQAGGVDIVATYVFWIHHEEVEGQWDWTGQRDLKRFVQTCGELGLKVVVRCGPWCHGEVRNGGFPDWVVAHKNWKLRSADTNFLAATKILYGEISKQLQGETWKEGGPVIGIQVDNEFGGSPKYLMALKKMAIAAGIDVPLYIKTGWPAMHTPVPLGELLPLFGAYPDGFWTRGIQPMEGNSWENFIFKHTRTDTGVGNDTLGNRKSGDTSGTEKYPYLTCEIGGGMPASYHRRINYDPRDVESVAFCQLGSGSSLMGYYMFHGGQNPEGKLSTMQESQATGYPNDLPVKSYDFNAPIGEFGQINPQYYWLRRLHLFLHDFGAPLAQMPATIPDLSPTNKNDFATLRWSVRSDGNSGFVFVNNYQRLQPLPAKENVQFKLNLSGHEFIFPTKPVTIPADEFFFWPFNLDLGGVKLIYATAQPVCKVNYGEIETFFFAETPGVKAEFVFDSKTLASAPAVFSDVKPSRNATIKMKTKSGGEIQIVLLDEADSLALSKGRFAGSERTFLTSDWLEFDGSALHFLSDNLDNSSMEISPAMTNVFYSDDKYAGKSDGIFQWIFKNSHVRVPEISAVQSELVQPAGRLREIPLSSGKSHIAIAPADSDFTNAAVWKIKLPPDTKKWMHDDLLLRIHYVGDVARLTLNGRLIEDNFYNGRDFDLGLKRYAPEILNGDLQLEILPLKKDAPIFIEEKAKPDFGTNASLAEIKKIEIVRRWHATIQPDSE